MSNKKSRKLEEKTAKDFQGGRATKRCKTCGIEFPLESYYWHDRRKNVRKASCPKCISNKNKVWRKENRETINARRRELYATIPNKKHNKLLSHVKSKYGISKEEYEGVLEKQNGVCAICGGVLTRKLSVDHDHSTGKFRGLLCTKCNLGLGCFNDDSSLLKRAMEYLDE